jgi:hypothetical protein
MNYDEVISAERILGREDRLVLTFTATPAPHMFLTELTEEQQEELDSIIFEALDKLEEFYMAVDSNQIEKAHRIEPTSQPKEDQ